MIKQGATTLAEYNAGNWPAEWMPSDWHDLVRQGVQYKTITSFENYFTPEITARFTFVGAQEEFLTWVGTDIKEIQLP
jgi:hypothetical protein